MSLEKLEKMGSLLDEEQRHGENQRSRVRVAHILPAIVLGLAGCAAIGLGGGGGFTWAGIVAFMIGLFTFIVINVRAIDSKAS